MRSMYMTGITSEHRPLYDSFFSAGIKGQEWLASKGSGVIHSIEMLYVFVRTPFNQGVQTSWFASPIKSLLVLCLSLHHYEV